LRCAAAYVTEKKAPVALTTSSGPVVKKKEEVKAAPSGDVADGADKFEFGAEGRSVTIAPDLGSQLGLNSSEQRQFQFDRVFGFETTQVEMFEDVAKGTVEDVLKGFNGTIFAYGQTGAGKSHRCASPLRHSDLSVLGVSHSMFGVSDNAALRGIIPRAASHLFEGINNAEDVEEVVRVAPCIAALVRLSRDSRPCCARVRCADDQVFLPGGVPRGDSRPAGAGPEQPQDPRAARRRGHGAGPVGRVRGLAGRHPRTHRKRREEPIRVTHRCEYLVSWRYLCWFADWMLWLSLCTPAQMNAVSSRSHSVLIVIVSQKLKVCL
jgi:hypothetical protein